MSSSSLNDGRKSFEKDKDLVPDSTQIEVAKASIHDAVELDEIEHTDTGWYIWLIALTASIGGMLFGYDTGIISAVLVYLEDSLGHLLSASEKELITSLCSAGAFVGSIIAGLTADRYGRKGPMYIGCALFTVGAVLQATAYSIPQMAVGRLIVGFGVGSAAMIVPAYIAEIAPTKHRGRMIGLNNVSITGGQVISYGLGAAFASVPHGWRYMVGLGGVPSVLLAILLPLCPESPRQLIYHDKHEEARAVLHRIFRAATPEQVQDKIQLIEAGVRESRATTGNQSRFSIVKQLHTTPAYFRALVCACGLSKSTLSSPEVFVSETNLVK
jgi:SP family myo-inositol transporter-like MFS transporter 13